MNNTMSTQLMLGVIELVLAIITPFMYSSGVPAGIFAAACMSILILIFLLCVVDVVPMDAWKRAFGVDFMSCALILCGINHIPQKEMAVAVMLIVIGSVDLVRTSVE